MAAEQATLDPKLLLSSLTAIRNGDFSVRLPVEWSGAKGKIADVFNEVVEMNVNLAAEIEKLNRAVGKEGKISRRA